MFVWETAFSNDDQDKKWTGEKGFITLVNPLWIKGLRLIMKTSDRYIGFNSWEIYSADYTT